MTTEPFEITAGDTVTWTKTLEQYPAPEWQLNYVLLNASHKIQITGVADGSNHLISVPAAVSVAYGAGSYKWQSYVTKGAERYTIATGQMTIKPDFATALAMDTRSHVKKTLDALEAMIEGKASRDVQEYSIQGRMLKHIPLTELMPLYEKYKRFYADEVASEKASKGAKTSKKIYVRF